MRLRSDHAPARDHPSWDFEPQEEVVPGRVAFRRLGGGRTYEAYLAWDDELFAVIVLKLVRPHLVDDEHALRGLGREAHVLERLNHPVIVRSFGARLDGARPHLALEHLEGPTLGSLIRRHGPLPLEQLLPLTLQICSGLHYLAERKLVHLDVKPRNVVMGAPPRMIDLSVARSFANRKRLPGPIGTEAYMAPEQCDPRRAPVTSATDVWGLGATLYHAVAGRVPFPRPPGYDRSDPRERWPQLITAPDLLPADVPSHLGDIIMRCLSPDPDERPRPSQIVADLEPLVASLPTTPVLRRVRRPRHR